MAELAEPRRMIRHFTGMLTVGDQRYTFLRLDPGVVQKSPAPTFQSSPLTIHVQFPYLFISRFIVPKLIAWMLLLI
jgi:hypothetical protein